jgi:hypothetical protein
MPFELITFLGSAILGAIKSMIMLRMKSKSRIAEAQLQALNAQAKIRKEVREHDDKGFKFTRRFIAVTITLAVVALPILSPYLSMYSYLFSDFPLPYLPVTFGYTELSQGFWPFVADQDVTKWVVFDNGLIITPFHTNLMAAVVGFYMGDNAKQ